ncbi:hypothetical protein Hdeb2414_s0034g00726941 [Helianthus debilis subsp. tardiflorus]
MGGLGVGKLKYKNKSLLSKWVWRYKVDPTSLWRMVVDACHGSNMRWTDLPSNPGISGVWNNIVKLEKKMFIKGRKVGNLMKGEVGNGENIRFLVDYWRPLVLKWPQLFSLNAGSLSWNWQWVQHPSSSRELADLQECQSILSSFRRNSREDSWKWLGDDKGVFSADSVRKLLIEEVLLVMIRFLVGARGSRRPLIEFRRRRPFLNEMFKLPISAARFVGTLMNAPITYSRAATW